MTTPKGKPTHTLPATDAALAASNPSDPVTGFVFGCILDGQGGARQISWDEADTWKPAGANETMWLHMDRTGDNVGPWLTAHTGITENTLEALLSNETRPRAFREGHGIVTILRGINFNPDAEREDMISLQIWADPQKVISLRRRPLQTPRDVLNTLMAGHGPRDAGDLLTALIEQLTAKMRIAIVDMNTHIDEMEELDVERDEHVTLMLDDIARIRRNCLALKRYMSPQHEALVEIGHDPPDLLSSENLSDIRETIDRLKRYMEDLDVSKESVIVLQDDLDSRASARTNQTMYILSVLTAIFLPLGFVTGLLGINVGGMPGVDSDMAFWVTVGLLVMLMGVQYALFKKLRWL